jgi:hypothetical protein
MTNIQERIDIMQAELNTLKSLAEQSVVTPKYALSDLMKETIQQTVEDFIREHIIDNIDRSYTVYASGDYCNVELNIDLQEIVGDQMRSPYNLADDFMERLQAELDTLKEQEQDEIAEQGDEQHQDC